MTTYLNYNVFLPLRDDEDGQARALINAIGAMLDDSTQLMVNDRTAQGGNLDVGIEIRQEFQYSGDVSRILDFIKKLGQFSIVPVTAEWNTNRGEVPRKRILGPPELIAQRRSADRLSRIMRWATTMYPADQRMAILALQDANELSATSVT